ncbi:MAG TPA: RsmB/NOP family class I SAM-dependent RNA methyltransferase [Azospira sp.]|nr:RsmB/NOP family class I SAM-dependent RNA methyltransferase [Azospira sp.]
MTHAPAPALFQHAIVALSEVLRLNHPADAALSRYFREHKQLGHRDRGFVAEAVFAILRHKRSLEALVLPQVNARRLLLAHLACHQGLDAKALEPLLRHGEAELVQHLQQRWAAIGRGEDHFDPSGPLGLSAPAIALDLPDWLYNRLLAQYGAEETRALVTALNQPAPLDLRVNSIKAERDAVAAQLAKDGIAATPTPYSPLGLRLQGKPALSRHPLFMEGAVEVQDEGSQLLGLLLAPKRSEMVADFCAGAGGKTLLLGALMRSTGRLYAFDVSEKRLANLKPRLARSGLSNVHPVRIESENDARIKRLAGKLDRVLVDAPCSGLGTLRRNPDLKWRQDEKSIAELTAKQTAILNSAARLVKAGGRLVYATCSLLQEENGAVADAFLASHPDFVAVPVADILAAQGIVLPGQEAMPADRLALLPHRHDSDAFFAAVFERRAK